MPTKNSLLINVLVAFLCSVATGAEVVTPDGASPRVLFGAERLRRAFQEEKLDPDIRVIITVSPPANLPPEGFRISTNENGWIEIAAGDDSGALYGCLELASRIRRDNAYPKELHFTDAPAMKLRGVCVGMQKTYILPGRKVYEYPYTQELFPFFYDKAMWTEYLDFLVANRMNSLYLWNGHPFSSLVKLPDYPYALEVSDEQFQQNAEMYRWLATECDKRGIWLVQMFYNLLLPKPFAEKHGLETQLSAPDPIAADYTRKSIAAFVKEYPNVGLMVCLGEALLGVENQIQWCTQVILPGVKDGMAQAGLTREPPVVIRTHATDARKVMPEALKVYSNLYTEAKFNGESLTTWEPRGVRQQLHLAMSRLGSVHLSNVHILANLEPFRYGAQRFIKKSVDASINRLGAHGLHLYPLFYWDWPYSPDMVSPRLKQWDRDWIWFEAWARYAWNPAIDETTDRRQWVDALTTRFGSREAAEKILDAYNDSGECAPRILRRFGITEGNRQTMSVGMFLDQLVNPDRYRPFPELWESQSPPGERLHQFVEREYTGQAHEGETPPQIVSEVLAFSESAVKSIDAAAPLVTKNAEEFKRLQNDIHCIRAMSQNYAAKVNAAMRVLRYDRSNDLADMEQAAVYLAESLEHFRELEKLTRETYTAANSMQTSQRKIPTVGGIDGKPANYHWSQLLPMYEKELADFQAKVEALKKGPVAPPSEEGITALKQLDFTLIGENAEKYTVKEGVRVFPDRTWAIRSIAPELSGLTGVRFSHEAMKKGKLTPIQFEVTEPVQVLIGYFQSPDIVWLKTPNLETDARAGEFIGIEPSIQNAMTIETLPSVDVHVFRYAAGKHTLDVRGKGSFLILGVIPQSVKIEPRDARRSSGK